LSLPGGGAAAVETRPARTSQSDSTAHIVRRGTLLPWTVLVCGAAVSILLFLLISHAIEDRARLRFEWETTEAKALIDLRIQFYTNVLYGLRALFATQDEVSRLDFHRFVDSLNLRERYPGFDLVNFAAHVRPHERRQFEEAVRGDTSLNPQGYPDFSIRPRGERSEYHVLVYLEPMLPFRFAFGLDVAANPALATDPQELVALQHNARDTGNLIASGRPIRVKANPDYTGLAMRLAVYRAGMPLDTVEQRRAAFIGTVGAGFNVQNLMKDVLSAETAQYMRFRLFDVGPSQSPASELPPANERLLFDNRQRNFDASAAEAENALVPYFSRDVTTAVGGRLWQIRFEAPRNAVIDKVDATLPWLVLVGGLFSTLLLTGFLYSLASSQRRAVALANEMTKDLRENRALLNEAQKLSHVGCGQYSPADDRMVWSEELYRIHGVDPHTFTPTLKSALELVHPDDRSAWQNVLAQAMTDGSPFTSEFRIVRSDGTVRDLRSLGEVITTVDGQVIRMLWSVLDITEQKQTEGALRASAEQLTALSRRLVEVQEAERRKLSRELHDRVGQNLTALSINLDILRTSLSGEGNGEHRTRLGDSSALLESTVDSIEDVMCELRPPMLDDYGLLPALHWYAREFSNRTGIHVDVHGMDHGVRTDPDTEIALFRISQEALNNVAKHAQARRVRIELDHPNGHSALTISDDGIGIERALDSAGRQRSGLGMITMRERAEALGGRFEVESTRAGGTHITVEIPSI
jgi:PAS domain S-box-containing protein